MKYLGTFAVRFSGPLPQVNKKSSRVRYGKISSDNDDFSSIYGIAGWV